MRTTGDALPASSVEQTSAGAPQRSADADYGCVDWFQYQEVLADEALSARVRVTSRTALMAASLTPPAVVGDTVTLRCA